MHFATQQNNSIDVVKLLIDNGAEVNAKNKIGWTPLSEAVFNKKINSVELLIEKAKEKYGEHSEEFKKFINVPDKEGNTTPLHGAAHEGNLVFVKLLIANGANIEATAKNQTPLECIKCCNKNEKVGNLLERVMELNRKIIKDEELLKNLSEQLTPEQKQSLKIEIQKRLEKNKEELKQLLKIELVDVISNSNLGNIEISSGQTNPTEQQIEDRLKEKNQQLDITKIKVENITETKAVIKRNDESYYPGEVTVAFIVGKLADSLGPSRSASGNNDGSARPTNENSDATDQGAGGSQSQGSNGIQQNNSDEPTNHNNLYDVPADNSCLFWSVATSYLLQVRKNIEEFRNRFIQLFGEENLKYLLHIHKLLQQYDLENNRNLNQLWYQDQTANNLVINFFRNRVVDYIQSNLDTIPNRDGELTFRSLIQDNNDIDTNYLEIMRQPSTWGGTPEIIAMSNILNANISVNNNGSYQPINQNSNNNNIAIYYVELTKGSGIHNHYNFALTPEENRTKHPIAINDNQGNVPVVDITKRPDNLVSTTPKPEANVIKLPVFWWSWSTPRHFG